MQLSVFFCDSSPLQTLEQHQAISAFWQYGIATKAAQPSKDLLLETLGIKNAQQQHPLAELLIQQEGLALESKRNLFLVQPVSLMLQRDTVTLAEISNLNSASYQAVTELLNIHFAADDISFIPSKSQQYWYLALHSQAVQTTLPEAALYQDVHGFQPVGDGATKLKQIMNEAQMLLHEHAVNHERDAQGLLPVNSIWLSGNGKLPRELNTQYDLLIGGDALLNAIHQHTGVAQVNSIAEMNKQSFKYPMLYVESIEAVDWLILYQMVRRWKMHEVKLHIPYAGETVMVRLNAIDCLKFWRQSKSLAQVIQIVNNS